MDVSNFFRDSQKGTAVVVIPVSAIFQVQKKRKKRTGLASGEGSRKPEDSYAGSDAQGCLVLLRLRMSQQQ